MVSKGPLSRPFSNLNRALFWTRTVMVWERLLPALFPFVLLFLLVAVAAQWGLFLKLPPMVHAGILAAGLLVAIFACVRAVMRFRQPTFTEVNTRLAVDNRMKTSFERNRLCRAIDREVRSVSLALDLDPFEYAGVGPNR